MSLPTITPEQARELMKQGARLVDIREPDEHAREHINGAELHPIAAFDQLRLDTSTGTAIIFHCRSGNRTLAHQDKLARAVECQAYVLRGGLDAWKQAGLPVNRNTKQPLELMRQVQIAAGSLTLLGVLLGFLLHPGFHVLAGFIGAGLTFAGVTGFCGLARLLRVLPWNKQLLS